MDYAYELLVRYVYVGPVRPKNGLSFGQVVAGALKTKMINDRGVVVTTFVIHKKNGDVEQRQLDEQLGQRRLPKHFHSSCQHYRKDCTPACGTYLVRTGTDRIHCGKPSLQKAAFLKGEDKQTR